MMMLHVLRCLSFSNSDTRALRNFPLCWNIMTGLSHILLDLHLNQYICVGLKNGEPENEHGITAQSPASADTSASSRVTQKLSWQCVLTLVDGPVNRKKKRRTRFTPKDYKT